MDCKVAFGQDIVLTYSFYNYSFVLNSSNVFEIAGSFGYDKVNGRCEAIPLWPDCSLTRSGSTTYRENCRMMESMAWYNRGLHGGQIIYLSK